MTRTDEELKIEFKTVVVFDICSSTTMLEDLVLTGNLQPWRNLLISLKKFMEREAERVQCEIYKFVGDGWILLFHESATGSEVIEFLDRLGLFYKTRVTEDIVPSLQGTPEVMGLTFGVDRGQLVRLEMLNQIEFIGRPINVAARLQSATKDGDAQPAYKVLFSKPAYNALKLPSSWRATKDSHRLRNIRGGDVCECFKVMLTAAENAVAREEISNGKPSKSSRTPDLGHRLKAFDKRELKSLLVEFRAKVKRASDVSLAAKLEKELLDASPPYISSLAAKQLAKWCSTKGALYQDGKKVAQKITQLLFGKQTQQVESGEFYRPSRDGGTQQEVETRLVETKCPACQANVQFWGKATKTGIQTVDCQKCGERLYSKKSNGEFKLLWRTPVPEEIDCPGCGWKIIVDVDPVPGTASEDVCSKCTERLRVSRNDEGRVRARLINPKRPPAPDEAFLSKVAELMGAQPWPKGRAQAVAKQLGVGEHLVQKAVRILIHRGKFKPQIGGRLYTPETGIRKQAQK